MSLDKFDRIFDLHRYFSARRRPATIDDIAVRLECNRSTAYRLLGVLRDQLDAPIEKDPETGGFIYRADANAPRYELPGLWFSAAELQALIVFQRLLHSLEPGLLDAHLAPLATRIDKLLTHRRLNLSGVEQRIRILGAAARPAGCAFRAVAGATLQRQRIRIAYHSRGRDQRTERNVSPQRLVHYSCRRLLERIPLILPLIRKCRLRKRNASKSR